MPRKLRKTANWRTNLRQNKRAVAASGGGLYGPRQGYFTAGAFKETLDAFEQDRCPFGSAFEGFQLAACGGEIVHAELPRSSHDGVSFGTHLVPPGIGDVAAWHADLPVTPGRMIVAGGVGRKQ